MTTDNLMKAEKAPPIFLKCILKLKFFILILLSVPSHLKSLQKIRLI